MSQRFLIIIVFILLIATFFLRYEKNNQPDISSDSTVKEPVEFFLNQSLTTRYRSNGTVHYRFNSDKLEYFKDSDIAMVNEPRMVIYNEQANQWYISASKAKVLAGGKGMRLEGDVRIWKTDAVLEIITDELYVIPEREYAETNALVTLKSTSGLTKSMGMRVDLKNEKFQLLSQVKGTYYAH